ncbi:hypothetical protein, partial [Gordonibacter massiliensis (ex Traore et al. 2017)]|uniref:hypothetical protein n=1 Tax=Gordonibacter massiliensis (ex Traore et al. 2017) TaxID=1841863 RepID=UPI001C8B7B11
MSMFEKLCDAKNTFEGKALAVFMAVVMAFSLSNLTSFANATEGDASSETPAAQDASNDAAGNEAAESTQAGDPETAAPAEEPAAPVQGETTAPSVQSPAPSTDLPTAEPGVAVVGLDFEHAYIKYLDQDLKAPLASFNAPLNKELAFTAHADTGYEIDKVKTVVNGAETELAADEQTGEYKVPADLVTSNLTIKVEAKAAESESPAPEDSSATPITSDTKIEAGEDAASNDVENAVEDEDVVKVEADVSNPAFEGYATAGNVLVKVTAAAGVLPEGATVQAAPVERQDVVDAVAEKVENQGKTLESATAIDVTLLDKDGNEIQPNGAVNVCFFDVGVEGEEVGVYRVSDDAATVETVGARQADASVQSFDVDHFTIYVIAGSEGEQTVEKAGSFKTILQGETIKLTSKNDDGTEYYETGDHAWTVLSGGEDVAEIAGTRDATLEVKGMGLGTMTLAHSFKYRTEAGGKLVSAVESVQVTVIGGLPVDVEFLDSANQVVSTDQANIEPGMLESHAPEYSDYAFLRAVVRDGSEDTPITSAEGRSEGVYYAVEGDLSQGVGLRLGESEKIVLQYRALGNDVVVKYTTSGADNVEGNEVVGFPSTATRGGDFSFRVDTARGYKSVVTLGGVALEPSGSTYTVTNAAAGMVVDVDFKALETVTFDPGVFCDTGYKYLYNSPSNPRFNGANLNSQTRSIGSEGAEFNFSFETSSRGGVTWQIDSFNINGVYLSIPHRDRMETSEKTTLYSDGTGACVATLSVTSYGTVNYYNLKITGAKEDLRIEAANLNNVTWTEVVPFATEGIDFYTKSPHEGSTGLNEPYATSGGGRPSFEFGLKEGYENLNVEMLAFKSDSSAVSISDFELPTYSGGRTTVSTGGWWWESAELATIENLGEGRYLISYNDSSWFGSSGVTLQFLKLSCERKTYGVTYSAGEGSGSIVDSASYDVVDNNIAVVTNASPTAPEGKFFYGWKLDGDASGKVYYAGDKVDFSDQAVQGLLKGDGTIGFTAQYASDLAAGESVPVEVEVYLQNDSGAFDLDTGKSFTVKGIMGKSLSYLNVPTYDGYVFIDAKSNTTVSVDGKNKIALYYGKAFSGQVTLDDWTYGDNPKAEHSFVLGGDYAQPTYCYKAADASDDSYTSEKPTDVGAYVVKAVWAATDNCPEIFATDDFSIGKRAVSLTGESAEKVYTGQSQTITGITSEGLLPGHYVEGLTYAATGTNVGDYDGAFAGAPVIKDADGADVAANYNVTTTPGKLTITASEI